MKKIEVYKNASLKKVCTFNIGGNANFLFKVHTNNAIKKVVKHCYAQNIKYKVIGCGANLLFDDLGYNGAIVVNCAKQCKIKGENIVANAGIKMAELIDITKKHNLSGLEAFAGIPSTLGGAVFNNLSAWGHELANIVVYVKGFYVPPKKADIVSYKTSKNTNTKYFKTYTLSNKECKFKYRGSVFSSGNFIITQVKLKLDKSNKSRIEQNIKTALTKKQTAQPLGYPNAGSVFKRSNILPAKLIDEAGLKGTTIGGAQVSTKHAGFIVNIGNATSKDVKALIAKIEEVIYAKYSATLEREIEYVD